MKQNPGYIFIDRQHSRDLAVRYSSIERARMALTDHILIEDLCQEDALDAYVPETVTEEDLEKREIIVADSVVYMDLNQFSKGKSC